MVARLREMYPVSAQSSSVVIMVEGERGWREVIQETELVTVKVHTNLTTF